MSIPSTLCLSNTSKGPCVSKPSIIGYVFRTLPGTSQLHPHCCEPRNRDPKGKWYTPRTLPPGVWGSRTWRRDGWGYGDDGGPHSQPSNTEDLFRRELTFLPSQLLPV